jgi:hypothetical protein
MAPEIRLAFRHLKVQTEELGQQTILIIVLAAVAAAHLLQVEMQVQPSAVREEMGRHRQLAVRL